MAARLDVLGDGLDVTVPRGRHLLRRAPGCGSTARRCRTTSSCDVGGLRVVTAARAVVDVARREPLVEAVASATPCCGAAADAGSSWRQRLHAASGCAACGGPGGGAPCGRPERVADGEPAAVRLVLGGLGR